LRSGRPLDTCMIVLLGKSGTGKSTTINKLFGVEVCETSATTSQTEIVSEFQQLLHVTAEEPSIKGYLSFVDVPGIQDVGPNREAKNFTNITDFREKHVSLSSRKIPDFGFQSYMRSRVYPNLVIFTMPATDKRIDGPNSDLALALKTINRYEIVDREFPNFIVVVTHAMTIPVMRYAARVKEISAIVEHWVKKLLGLPRVEIVFIENDPEGYCLEKPQGSDFYLLPDKEYSHKNLIDEMSKIFQRNEDLLSQLLCGWYFKSDCPEKGTLPRVIPFEATTSEIDLQAASKLLAGMGFVAGEYIPPLVNFPLLGRGFCPVTEVTKPLSALQDSQELVDRQLGNHKFTVPSNVSLNPKNSSNLHNIVFESKEKYVEQRKLSYGIEGRIPLVIQCEARGRWVDDETVKQSNVKIGVLHEDITGVARVNLDEPKFSKSFLQDVNNLPAVYSSETQGKFNLFFGKWGTHFIIEQYMGGAIKIDFTIEKGRYTNATNQQLKSEVTGMYNGFRAAPGIQGESRVEKLYSLGVTDRQIYVQGGNLHALEVSDMDAAKYSNWCESIQASPIELEHHLGLWPYYHLVSDIKPDLHTALHEATLDYLKSSVAQAPVTVNRNDIANQMVTSAKNEPPKCFPSFAKIRTLHGFKAVSELSGSDRILSLQNTKHSGDSGYITNKKLQTTDFLTYLHKNNMDNTVFLALYFDNGCKLLISGEHLLFKEDHGKLKPVKADALRLGDHMWYVNENGGISAPQLVSIKNETQLGYYAPLTESGTLIVDGFFVSCYADVDSFELAHTSMFPLRLWHKVKKVFGMNEKKSMAQSGDDLHAYARGLMKVRKVWNNLL